MSVTLTSSRTFTLTEKVSDGQRAVTEQLSVTVNPAWVATPGALGITRQWCRGSRLLNATAETLDLSGGTLLNSLGVGVTFAKVKKFSIRNIGAGTITVDTTIANGWRAAFNGVLVLPPGASLDFECPDTSGWAVTPDSGDLFRITASSSGGQYEIAIAGE